MSKQNQAVLVSCLQAVLTSSACVPDISTDTSICTYVTDGLTKNYLRNVHVLTLSNAREKRHHHA